MSLSKEQITDIENVLKQCLRNKFQNYQPEPASMPFHTRLLGKDRMALFSFIHSLNTSFGTSIFEPVALTIAKMNFEKADSHVSAGKYISEMAEKEIQKIIDNLTAGYTSPNKIKEIEKIRSVCQKGEMREIKRTEVDILLENINGELFLFDLKTAKPNLGDFNKFKKTLLEWAAMILALNPDTKINTLIAIPYNPYEPEPYQRWTIAGMLDLKYELKVADEFWVFLGKDTIYQDLLDCFERVGIELRPEIDDYFSKFSIKNKSSLNN